MQAAPSSSGRPGFYFRVLEEGEVGAGDEITKVADGPEHITVADIDALHRMYVSVLENLLA